jgi:hypothetical protein
MKAALASQNCDFRLSDRAGVGSVNGCLKWV